MRHKPHEALHCRPAALDIVTDITGVIVTADALLTVAGHARHLPSRGAFGLSPVKGNRPALISALDTQHWDETTNPHISVHRADEKTSTG